MIVLTVGMQLGFDRLIAAMDALAPTLGMPVIARTGKGSYQPQNMEARVKIAPAEFEALVGKARLIVAHAGINMVLTATRCGKPILLVPRRAARISASTTMTTSWRRSGSSPGGPAFS